MMKIYAKKLLTPAGWAVDRVVETDGERIVSISAGTSGDMEAPILTAGFIDEHNHGGRGFEALAVDNTEGLADWLLWLGQRGITGVLMTPGAALMDRMQKAMAFAAWAMQEQKEGRLPGARILGVHLEGPFINPKRAGAIVPESMIPAKPESYEEIVGEYGDIVRLITVAPELEGADKLIAYLRGKGVKVQAGHTDADYDQAMNAFGAGVDGVCHTFNANRSIHHREPNLLTAALLSPNVFCEAICDMVHLHPAIVRLIVQNKTARRTVLVSDATVCQGLPDGYYECHEHPVIVKDGVSRIPAGNLSGGAVCVTRALQLLIENGVKPEDAFIMGTMAPAEHLGLDKCVGSIEPGKLAHLAAFDENYNSLFTVIGDQVLSMEG